MELYKIRNRISMGESIYELPLKVTFYARVSTDKDVQLNSLDNQILYFKDFIKNNKKNLSTHTRELLLTFLAN